ncbi:hypothetical protein HID58_093828 [Brassica napus]|uniref:Uncharacterized protein n=1 Tax=Brassica napus TaxID=3708 RepID=A0ABQ7XA29_BRANA|nr:hypothetical protein HID58_093828 [Brassica napus]
MEVNNNLVMESTQRQVLLSIYSMAMPISLPVSLWSPCVLAGLSAGMAIGIVGDAGVRNVIVMCVACHVPLRDVFGFSECTTTKALCGMILILIFAKALSLYGLIVGIILSSRAGQARVERTLKVS